MTTIVIEGGERMELQQVLHLYGDYCLRIAYTYTKDLQAAEEIVQDVFLQYNPEVFKQQSSLKTYVVKITINKCHDYNRKLSRRTKTFLQQYLPGKKEQLSVNDTYDLEQSEVTKVILDLPMMYREVIILHYYEDYKLQEIADLLAIPLSTVKTRHARAKRDLKNKLVGVELDG